MPGAPTSRYYFGDFRLWKCGDTHLEDPTRQPVQEHVGVDNDHVLVVTNTLGQGLGLAVLCVGEPNPVATNAKGWRALKAALRTGLWARGLRKDPVTWVADDTRSKAVTSWAAPTVTSAAHGFSNGDVVLVRRAGLGLWSLAAVSAAAANTFNLTAVAGTSLHAIQAADELHLVEAYYLGMASLGFVAPVPDERGDWMAERVTYNFRGAGRYTYNRTAATVGS